MVDATLLDNRVEAVVERTPSFRVFETDTDILVREWDIGSNYHHIEQGKSFVFVAGRQFVEVGVGEAEHLGDGEVAVELIE